MINYLEMGESWKQDRRARDNEDKPFEDEDLPSGFDSDKSDSEVKINLTLFLLSLIFFIPQENDWSDWRGNLSGKVILFLPGLLPILILTSSFSQVLFASFVLPHMQTLVIFWIT